MKRNLSYNYISPILILGSLWGLFEATIGWVMHLVHFKNTSLILYPAAALLMSIAIRKTGKSSAALGVAAVASAIKLTNLFYGTVPAYWVINPALSILLEGVSVFFVYRILNNLFSKSTRLTAMIESFVILFVVQILFTFWRIFSNAYISENPNVLSNNYDQLFGTDALVSLYKLSVLFILTYLIRNVRMDKFNIKLSWSLFLCVMAICVNQII